MLAQAGFEQRVEPRSYVEQGIAFEPTRHEGYYARQRAAAGKHARIRAENEAIRARNRARAILDPALI
jgi:hypothetical protein